MSEIMTDSILVNTLLLLAVFIVGMIIISIIAYIVHLIGLFSESIAGPIAYYIVFPTLFLLAISYMLVLIEHYTDYSW